MSKVGRNDPCPCGSGIKYKKCCAGLNDKTNLKFGDKVIGGTHEDVKKNLNYILSLIVEKADIIEITDKKDSASAVLKQASLYAALQLRLLIEVYDFPIEYIAWISRNLFEINLILEYVLVDSQNADDFCLQKGSDEIDILEGQNSLKSEDLDVVSKPIVERIEHLKKTLTKYGRPKLRHFSVSKMAKAVGMKDEYEAFFKFYSKYVHPSAWLIFASENEKDNLSIRTTFMLQTQYYGSRILKILEDHTKDKT